MKAIREKFIGIIFIILSLGIVACNKQGTQFSNIEQPNTIIRNDDNPIEDPPVYEHASKTDLYIQNSEQKVDILWIIDNSGSMEGEQSDLASNFGTFINDFLMQSIDFKMAITTTDSNISFSQYDGKDGQNACNNSYLTSSYAAANEEDFKDRFSNCINVGTDGSGTEKGLNGAERYLERHGATFLRPDAFLIIMILSDEEDKSSKSVQEYVNQYSSFKDENAGLIKVYSIINSTTGDIQSQYESIGTRYKQISTLSNGVFASIRSQFSQTLGLFSTGILTLLSSFPLSENPSTDPNHDDIFVQVNGVSASEYVFDPYANTIQFNIGYVPATDSIIQIEYQYIVQ
ncbi:MAG: VWA domain-containing protein [Bacteriovoracaceae bacterium]|jgi:hypothetical protein|nr:VWA domain-containing protein [Bacteriovoracaceae bacterium]